MKKELNKEQMEKVMKVIKDLERFIPKLNEMILETGRGEAPQILKVTLIKQLIDDTIVGIEKGMGKEKVKEADRIITKFIEKVGNIKTCK